MLNCSPPLATGYSGSVVLEPGAEELGVMAVAAGGDGREILFAHALAELDYTHGKDSDSCRARHEYSPALVCYIRKPCDGSRSEVCSITARMYRAFISYGVFSLQNLASAIQRGFEQFAKKWYQRRSLRVFRDSTKSCRYARTLALHPGRAACVRLFSVDRFSVSR